MSHTLIMLEKSVLEEWPLGSGLLLAVCLLLVVSFQSEELQIVSAKKLRLQF